jgi:transposase
MPSNKPGVVIELTSEERFELEQRARSLTLSYRDVVRAKIVLLFVDGVSLSAIARRLGRERNVARLWVGRFAHQRLEGLADREGRGRKPTFSPGGPRPHREARVRAA